MSSTWDENKIRETIAKFVDERCQGLENAWMKRMIYEFIIEKGILGAANVYLSIDEKFQNHPGLMAVVNERCGNGSYGASGAYIEWIKRLLADGRYDPGTVGDTLEKIAELANRGLGRG